MLLINGGSVNREEFFSDVIKNYIFTQQAKSKLSLTFTEYAFLLYFTSHDPCLKFREVIVEELGTTLKTYKEITEILSGKGLLIRGKHGNNTNIFRVNYGLIALVLRGQLSLLHFSIKSREKKKEKYSKNKEMRDAVGVPSTPAQKVEVGVLGIPAVGVPSTPANAAVGVLGIPAVGVLGTPYIDSSINNLEIIIKEDIYPEKNEEDEVASKKKNGKRKKADNAEMHQDIMDYLNETLRRSNAPQFKRWSQLTEARVKLLNSYLDKLKTLEEWQDFINLIMTSDFLTGRKRKVGFENWGCTLEWCLKPDKFIFIFQEGGHGCSRDKLNKESKQGDYFCYSTETGRENNIIEIEKLEGVCNA